MTDKKVPVDACHSKSAFLIQGQLGNTRAACTDLNRCISQLPCLFYGMIHELLSVSLTMQLLAYGYINQLDRIGSG